MCSSDLNEVYVNDLAYEMGFRTGDRILKFDDYEPKDFGMLQADLARRSVRKATVERAGDTVDIYIDRAMIGQVINSADMFALAVPFVVDSVMSSSPNSELRHGDKIVAMDSEPVNFVQDSRPILQSRKGGDIDAKVLRGADTLDMNLAVDTTGRIGVYMQIPGMEKRHYNILQAIPAGLKYTFSSIGEIGRASCRESV